MTAGYGLRAAGCGLRAAGCGLRAAGYGLRATGYRLRATGFGVDRAAIGLQFAVGMAAESMTTTSIGRREGCSFSPSCSGRAVKIEGPPASLPVVVGRA